MEIWKAAKEEVGLSGLEGCTWKELRFSLSIRTPPVPVLDRHTEVYLWKKLLFDKDIILQTLPEPRFNFPLLGRQLRIDEEYRPFPFSLNTVLEGDLRGSCSWFERRKDVTEEMRQSEMSLTEVEEKYADQLVVVGSQELREGALVLAGVDPTVLQMEPIMYCVLEAVAQFRQFGVFRPQLTQAFLKEKDARKTWHIIRRLARMRLVVVKEVNYGKPPRLKNISSQHRVFHVRYADSGSGLTLHNTQTLKSEEMEDEEDDIEDRNDVDRSHVPVTQTSLVAELPLNHQIFSWIDSFGPSGVTSVEFNEEGPRICSRMRAIYKKHFATMPSYVTTTCDPAVTKTIRIISKRTLSSHGNEDPTQPSQIQEILIDRHDKRKRMILDMFREATTAVISGDYPIRQHITNTEKREGRVSRIDKKTVMRLLNELVKAEQIKELTIGPSIHPGLLKEETLYFLFTTPEEEVTAYIQSAIDFGLKSKAASHTEDVDTGEDVEESEMEDVCPDDHPVELFGNHFVSGHKFQKLQQLHLYLWIMTFGFPVEESSSPESLPVELFPWLQIPAREWPKPSPPGILLQDIIDNMPLVLVAMATGPIKVKPSTVPPSVRKFLGDPENRFVVYRSMPRKVRTRLRKLNKDGDKFRAGVMRLLVQLRSMGLVHFNLDTNIVSYRKHQLLVNVSSVGSFLDTSECPPRRSFFTNEARHTFSEIKIPLNSVKDVLKYWFGLREVCLSTQILSVTGKRALASTSSVSDEHKLLYDISKRVQNVEYYDTLGFGAGGLPPSSFSHILRNWGNFTKPEQFVHDNRTLTGHGRVIQVPKETVAVRQGGRGLKRPFRSTDDENSPKAKKPVAKQKSKQVEIEVMEPALEDEDISGMPVHPQSLAELTDMYHVSDPASTNVATPMLVEIRTEADRNHTLLLDVIYSVLLANLTYDVKYKGYKMLESFPEEQLQYVFKWLRQRFLLKEKKCRLYSRSESRKYVVAASVRERLLGKVPFEAKLEIASLYRSLFPKPNYNYDTCERPMAEESPQPVAEESLQPVGEECPQPVGVTSNRVDSAMLSVIMATMTSECTDLEPVLLENLKFSFPSHFMNEYENTCHMPNNFGSSCDDVIDEGDVEDEGEGDSGDEKDPDRRRDPSSVVCIPETVTINPTSVQATPSVGPGMVLEPPEGTTPLQALSDPQLSEHALTNVSPLSGAQNPSLSLEDYMTVAGRHLGHDNSDCLVASKVVEMVKEAGPLGLELSAVEEVVRESGVHWMHEDYIVQTLLNLNMVHQVGTTESRLVHSDHVDGWHHPSKVNRCQSEENGFQFQIWSDIATNEISGELFSSIKHSVYRYISTHPGVTWPLLKTFYCQALQPSPLEAILKVLIEDGCITAHTLYDQAGGGVFSMPSGSVVMATGLEFGGFKDTTYFEPFCTAEVLVHELS